MDRVLRPLFPKDYHYETQVMIQLMSHDEDVMPDALAGLAASAAIQLSDFPFECASSVFLPSSLIPSLNVSRILN